MSSKNPEVLENLILNEFQDDGSCSASYPGDKLKIFGGIPGEIVNVEVIRKFDDELICMVSDVIKPSKDRVQAECKFYLNCSGCQFQHLSYQAQLDFKKNLVFKALDGLNSFSEENLNNPIPSPKIYNYRNHGRFTVAKSKEFRGNLGFVNRWTRKLVQITDCKIMDGKINEILAEVKGKVEGYSQFSIRAGINSKEYLIQPSINNLNKFESGQKSYLEIINGNRHKISSPSFFQVNTAQATKLGKIIKANLNLKGEEVVMDAFSGVGTFAILLSKYVKKIYAVETSYSSVEDARFNIKSLKNIELIFGEVEKIDKDMFEPIDVIILDPSRKGVHPDALSWVGSMSVKKLVYVSCNVQTLRRDLNYLTNKYEIRKVIPIDMFPHTKHIETIVVMKLKDNKKILKKYI
jgi:23S rRNA (uracil1939-C5)-methyltransferase